MTLIKMAGRVAITALITACLADAQNDPIGFDVASIRVNSSSSEAIGGDFAIRKGGQISVRNITLKDLVCLAYGVESYRISGVPGGSSTVRYDVEAKSATPVADDVARTRLQNLLAERFNLKLHRDTQKVNGYVLLKDKRQPKLQPSKALGEVGFRMMTTRDMSGEGISLAMFARTLKHVLRAPVEDRTGIAGLYDISLEWTPEDAIAAGESGASIVTAVREQLGLVIKSYRVPVEILVIDHAEKQPLEN